MAEIFLPDQCDSNCPKWNYVLRACDGFLGTNKCPEGRFDYEAELEKEWAKPTYAELLAEVTKLREVRKFMKIEIQEDYEGEWVVIYVGGEKYRTGHSISDVTFCELLRLAGAEVVYKIGTFIDDNEDDFREP